jgi:BON domain
MSQYFRVLRSALLGLTMLAAMSGPTTAVAQSVAPEETVRSVRRMLERLPYYGVFDYHVLQELSDERHFPGTQPVGIYPIHIIVKNGRTMLWGIVANATDRQLAEVRAREVTGVFEVENSLSVARSGQEGASK